MSGQHVSNDEKTMEITSENSDLELVKKIIALYTEQNYTITDISLKIFGTASGQNRDKVSKVLKQAGIEIRNRGGQLKGEILDLHQATMMKSAEMTVESLDKLNKTLRESNEAISPGKILQIQAIGKESMSIIKEFAVAEKETTIEIDKDIVDEGILERLRERSDGREVIDEPEHQKES